MHWVPRSTWLLQTFILAWPELFQHKSVPIIISTHCIAWEAGPAWAKIRTTIGLFTPIQKLLFEFHLKSCWTLSTGVATRMHGHWLFVQYWSFAFDWFTEFTTRPKSDSKLQEQWKMKRVNQHKKRIQKEQEIITNHRNNKKQLSQTN